MPRYRSPAVRRYLARLLALMTIYVVLIIATGHLFQHDPPTGLAAYAFAVLPALPIVGVIWAVMRLLVEEDDEFQRMLFTRQTLFATGFCLSISTIWEFLQLFDLAPAVRMVGFGATSLWFIGLGIGGLVVRLPLRGGEEE